MARQRKALGRKRLERFITDLKTGSRKEKKLLRLYWSAFAHRIYTEMYDALVSKSFGQPDSLGNTWEDISPRTKAYGRKELRKGLRLRGPKGRPTLTNAQDRRWRQIFVETLNDQRSELRRRIPGSALQAALQLQNSENESRAAARAWAIVKETMGARTLMMELAEAQARIGHRSGTLINSFKPTKSTTNYKPRQNQVFNLAADRLILGTTVEYASDFHEDRPLWPEDMSPWIQQAHIDGQAAVAKELGGIRKFG